MDSQNCGGMEPQGNQQNAFIETRRVDGSFDMSSTEFRTLAAEIGGPLNTATDTLLGAFEPLRTNSETEPLLAPLDDILKDIYDIKSAFTPTSTASIQYPVVSNPSQPCQPFLPNFTSPSRNLTYGNFINNEVPYGFPCPSYGMAYLPPAGQNFMPVSSPVVQMPVPMQPTTHLVSVPEEDNDGPIYLNFNIGNMPPSMAPFQNYQQPPPPTVDMGGTYTENNVRYVEFLNETGDPARARYFDSSAKGFREYRTYRQNSMNAVNKMQFAQPNIEGCSKYIYATEVNPEPVKSNETPIPVENEENSFGVKQNFCESIKPNGTNSVERWTSENVKTHTITYSEEPNIVICRPPLRTKRTVMENSEISLQISGGEQNGIGNLIGVEYIAVIDNSDVDIPTIRYSSPVGRMKRKQEFKIRKWEDEVSFEEPNLLKSEVERASCGKMRSSPVYRTPVNKQKPLSEEMFLGKRKRKSSTPPASFNNRTDDSDYRSFCGDLRIDRRKSRTTPSKRDSYRTKNSRRLLDCVSAHERTAKVIPSSDSDLDDMPLSSSKSLKCPKCKKIFKTPRSLAIHQKRCAIPSEVESDSETTMVEYLESEKELDGADEVLLDETSGVTTSVTVIEKIEENIVEKTDELKEEQRENEIQEKPLRRSTRSLTNSIASKKFGQNNDPKPGNGQGKMKTATNKGTNANSRGTRRKKK